MNRGERLAISFATALALSTLSAPFSTAQNQNRILNASASIIGRIIVPVPGFRCGLFVEIVLADDDDEYPAVLIVNAHEQRR